LAFVILYRNGSSINRVGEVGVDWNNPAEDRDKWRIVVNTVMNLRLLQNVGNFLN
jgi:hypothetical protein